MPTSGVFLEARVQRLFLAQGVFAERSLWPATDDSHRMLVTDIDVLVSEYASGFHLTRRHAECKAGKNVSILDRMLWLNGVRTLLGADASYLVLPSFDESATEFAKNLKVDVMTFRQLETWEKAFTIPKDRWPNRSDFKHLDPIKDNANKKGNQKTASDEEILVRQINQFVDIDSWREFGYGRLNRLLDLFRTLSDVSAGIEPDATRSIESRFAASALLVRLSQYLLAVCLDVSRVPLSDIGSYLQGRLVFGDQDAGRAWRLVQGTVDWMSEALRVRGMSVPPEANSSTLFETPKYSDGLIELIRKLLVTPNEARYLPIAMETDQFGKTSELEMFPRLRSAWNIGHDLATWVRAFVVASVGVESSLLAPVGDNSGSGATSGPKVENDDSASTSTQPELGLEGPVTAAT